MIVRSSILAVILVSGTFLAGCSSSEPVVEQEYFEPVEKKAKESDRETAPTYLKPRPVENKRDKELQKMVQEQQGRIDKLEREVAALVTEQRIEAAERNMAQRQSGGEETLLALIREQNLRLDEIIEQVRLIAERRAAPPVAKPTPTAAPPARAVVARVDDAPAHALYRQAVEAYNNKNYRESIRFFEASLARGIRRSLVDNCRFWIGVCRFQSKEYPEALTQLGLVTRDRSSDKRSSALLIEGQTLDQLGRRDLARMSYQRIIREYPRSNLRQVAEQKMTAR